MMMIATPMAKRGSKIVIPVKWIKISPKKTPGEV